MSTTPPNHYQVLGISPVASVDEIKKRYRELARRYHPDVDHSANAEERFRLINEAYRVLSDSHRRLVYDSELKLASMKQGWRPPGPSPTAPPPRPRPPFSSSAGANRGGSWQAGGGTSSRQPRKPRAPRPPREPDSSILLERARAAFRRMRFREAEMLCRQAARVDRRNPAIYELLGDIQRARGETDQAIAMYSYALQLDRNNPELRQKFDRLVGQSSGPTMAGHAAWASRQRGPARKKGGTGTALTTRVIVGATGSSLVGGLAALVAREENPAAPIVFLCIGLSSLLAGGILALNGALTACRNALSARRTGAESNSVVPIGAILIGFSALCYYAALLVYAAVCATQRRFSPSIILAFAVSFGIVGLFAVVSHAGMGLVLLLGGNVAFLSLLAGWSIADALRAAV